MPDVVGSGIHFCIAGAEFITNGYFVCATIEIAQPRNGHVIRVPEVDLFDLSFDHKIYGIAGAVG